MVKSIKGTKTSENLAKAFAGESMALSRYMIYSECARKEKLFTIEKIFYDTASDERAHAEVFFEYLTEEPGKTILKPEIIIPAAFGKTDQNLLYALEGEHEEWANFYPKFGKEAEMEGFFEIAQSFYKIATIEKRHEARYRYLLERMKQKKLFGLPFETKWVCTNCGLYIKGNSAPEKCPACHHPQSFFMTIYDETYND